MTDRDDKPLFAVEDVTLESATVPGLLVGPHDAEEDVRDVDDDLVRELTTTADRAGTMPTVRAELRVLKPTSGDLAPWQQRAQWLLWEATAATSPRRAALLWYELGRVYEQNLAQPDRALEAYQQSFARFPAFAPGARALVRLLVDRGDYAPCVAVLEAELNAAGTAEERTSILAERAQLRMVYLHDLAGALEDLHRAQKIEPDDPVVLDLLLEICRHAREHGELELLLRHRTRACEDPNLGSALLCEVARLREQQLHDPAGAGTAYRTALNMAPANRVALHALLRTARLGEDFPAVARLWETLAEMEQGSASAAAYWAAARVYRDRLRNAELATAALERACERAPEDRALLVELAEQYERGKTWDRLALALERAANLTGDSAESAVLFGRLARVKVERLQDAEGAIDALRQALHLAPDNIPDRRMLGRLYARHDRHEELVGLLSDELELYTDPGRRSALAFRIGSLYESKLDDPERAAEFYEQALRFQPGYRPALRAVSRVYDGAGRHEDLVAVYERELATCGDRDERALLLRRISEIWEQKLGDPAAALSSYERLVAVDPTNLPALHALRRLYAMGNRWKDLVAVLKSDADQCMDRWRRVTLLTEVAEVQERRLGDDEGALQTYDEVLGLAPRHQPALMAAGRIFHRLDRHEDLLRLHRRELEHVEENAHRVWLLMKIGRILWRQLGRLDEAAAAFSEATALCAQGTGASHDAALDQLLRIHRQTGNQSALLQVLQAMPLPPRGPALSLHQRRIAEVLQRGQRPALAVEHLRRALDASDDDAALYQLAQIYAAIGDRQGLINLHLAEVGAVQDPRGRMTIYHKLSRLWSETEHDLERAVEALEHVIELDPRNQIALHRLGIELARLEQWGKLTAVLELSREPSEDLDYKVACALLVAALKEDRLGDAKGAAHSSYEVLGRFATHPEALAVLEQHCRESGNTRDLLQVLGRYLEVAQSTSEQASILGSIGALHAQRGELAEAEKMFRSAVAAMPEHIGAVRGWLRAARQLHDAPSTAEALEAEGQASQDPARAAACYFEAAQIWLQSEQQERAVGAYHKVLATQPTHKEALDALSALYTSRKQWAELVRLLQDWATHLEDSRRLKSCLARVADLQRSRLDDNGGARRTLQKALEIAPDDQPLLTAMAELSRAEGDWPALVQTSLRLLELTGDAILRKALYFELGMVWEERLPDTPRAIAAYQHVLEIDPGDLGALTRLSSLLLREKDWKGAAEVTQMLLERDDDRNRVKGYHLRLAMIYCDGFNDLKRAVESCRRALSLDPGDLEATDRMARLLSLATDMRALEAHLASTLAVHRARIDRDPFRIESYRALLKVFAWQRAADPVQLVKSVLTVIGAATEEERASAAEVQRLAAQTPERPLTTEEVEELLTHPDERGALHRVLDLAEPPLRKLFPPLDPPSGRAEKLGPRSAPDLADVLTRLRRALGGIAFNAYLVDGGAEALRVLDTAPPTLFVGRELVEEVSPAEAAYLLARKVAHVRLKHTFFARLDTADFGRAVAAILAVVCHSYSPPFPPAELEELQVGFHRALGKRLRRQLEPPCLELSDRTLDPARWRMAMEQSEDRVALAVCGELQAALHCLLREEAYNLRARLERPEDYAAVAGPRMRQLLNFAISEEYITLRERVGMAVPPDR